MPSKSHFTAKQDREAKRIMKSEEQRGVSPKTAKAIGYATVNKQRKSKGR